MPGLNVICSNALFESIFVGSLGDMIRSKAVIVSRDLAFLLLFFLVLFLLV
jgi:hypothetical protein